MPRHLLGIVALGMLLIGAAAYGGDEGAMAGACLRIGAVLGLLWLAWPQLQNVPRWLVAMLAVLLLVALRWPRLLWAALPLAAVLWLLRPRRGRTARRPAEMRD